LSNLINAGFFLATGRQQRSAGFPGHKPGQLIGILLKPTQLFSKCAKNSTEVSSLAFKTFRYLIGQYNKVGQRQAISTGRGSAR